MTIIKVVVSDNDKVVTVAYFLGDVSRWAEKTAYTSFLIICNVGFSQFAIISAVH